MSALPQDFGTGPDDASIDRAAAPIAERPRPTNRFRSVLLLHDADTALPDVHAAAVAFQNLSGYTAQ